jgi:hypothetical protein
MIVSIAGDRSSDGGTGSSNAGGSSLNARRNELERRRNKSIGLGTVVLSLLLHNNYNKLHDFLKATGE